MDLSVISHESLAGKVIRLPFKVIPAGAVVRVLRGPARGKRWISDSTARGFWLGRWELENQRRFAAHLRPGDVVYDIGAHVGLYTLISSDSVGPRGHVYAFEPLSRNVKYLRLHVQLNRSVNCTIVEAAVSDSCGLRRFDPTLRDTTARLSETGAANVRTVTLDEFVFSGTGTRPPHAIKVNAEGAEMEILIGARRTIAEFSPLIFLSTHSDEVDHQCCEFLQSAGYSVERLGADKLWAQKNR
jgi:FkbM family methyltransferase